MRVKELGYLGGEQPPIRYLPCLSGSAGWGNAMNPLYRRNPSSDFVRNTTVAYLSNATGMNETFYPLEASFSPNNRPLAVFIKILLVSVILRKCLR